MSPANRLIPPLYSPPLVRASYATVPAASRGRFYPEPESPTRTCFSRDRDRIIHSTAFRRLKHKTQVFVHDEGDYYRTRLTHSLEVAQIARSMARVLALDEDLAEAVALAHDLGHTPFGHAGETALSAATEAAGGFDHNAHALRLLTKLEHRYRDFDGLNLTWEVLEGLVKHNGPVDVRSAKVPEPILSFDRKWPLDLQSWCGLEAQIAALADDIAYINHDIDDGLRAALFTAEDIADAPLAGPFARDVLAQGGDLELSRFIGELVRGLMSALIGDLLRETRARLAVANPSSAADVRAAPTALASFSSAMANDVVTLKKFLHERMYRHPRVMQVMDRAMEVVAELCSRLSRDPALMPPDWAERCGGPGDVQTLAVVRDYIAGMTDRYALTEYTRITGKDIVL